MERLAGDHPDIAFERVDADKQGELADRYGVKALPTYVLINNAGKKLGLVAGGHTFQQLGAWLDKTAASQRAIVAKARAAVKDIHAASAENGLDKITNGEIDAEIAESRKARRQPAGA